MIIYTKNTQLLQRDDWLEVAIKDSPGEDLSKIDDMTQNVTGHRRKS